MDLALNRGVLVTTAEVPISNENVLSYLEVEMGRGKREPFRGRMMGHQGRPSGRDDENDYIFGTKGFEGSIRFQTEMQERHTSAAISRAGEDTQQVCSLHKTKMPHRLGEVAQFNTYLVDLIIQSV